jgi:hypothetical protein
MEVSDENGSDPDPLVRGAEYDLTCRNKLICFNLDQKVRNEFGKLYCETYHNLSFFRCQVAAEIYNFRTHFV